MCGTPVSRVDITIACLEVGDVGWYTTVQNANGIPSSKSRIKMSMLFLTLDLYGLVTA